MILTAGVMNMKYNDTYVEKWLKSKYDVIFGSGAKKMMRKYQRDFYTHYSMSGNQHLDTKYQTDYSVDLHFLPDSFADFCHDMGNIIDRIERSEMALQSYEKMEKAEKQLRENNPALDKAYRNYKLLLRLVSDGKHIDE